MPSIHENKTSVEVPTFEVIASGGPFPYKEGPPGCHLSFTCPKCGKKNSHGGEYDNIGGGDGHRCSHCPCWPKGYYLREVPAAGVVNQGRA